MKFTKMHGLGNDFILTSEYDHDLTEMARKLCARRTAVGADGLIAALPSDTADIRMRIINSDGSPAEMCGNGLRCFARFVYDNGLVSDTEMTVETDAGIMKPKLLLEDGEVTAVRVNMGEPVLDPDAIPVNAADPLELSIDVDGAVLPAAAVLMGVPHAVLYVDEVDEETLASLGRAIETHPMFPRHTNVNFVQITGPDTLRVRTWERGAGRTMACGTGSCAAAFISNRKGLVGPHVTIELDAGNLDIQLADSGEVFMTGPAEYVFDAETRS